MDYEQRILKEEAEEIGIDPDITVGYRVDVKDDSGVFDYRISIVRVTYGEEREVGHRYCDASGLRWNMWQAKMEAKRLARQRVKGKLPSLMVYANDETSAIVKAKPLVLPAATFAAGATLGELVRVIL